MKKKNALVLLLSMFIGCKTLSEPIVSHEQVTNTVTDVTETSLVEAVSTLTDEKVTVNTTIEFCRDLPEINKLVLDRLVKEGWQYQGPIHNDGINCSVILWTKDLSKEEYEKFNSVKSDAGSE